MRNGCLFVGLLLLIVWSANAQPEWIEGVIASDFDGANIVRLVDMDSDGDLDLVGGAVNNGIRWWESIYGVAVPHIVTPDYDDLSDLEIADMDGDGDMDIVACDWYAEEVIRIYQNTEEGWQEHVISTDGAVSIDLGDIDDDGDIDILAGDDLLFWYENVEDGFTFHLVDPVPCYVVDVEIVDMDQDGDMDFLIANHGSSQGPDFGDVSWYENMGLLFVQRPVADPFYSANNVEAVDLDNDGDLDIAGGATGQLRFWIYTPSGWVQYHMGDDNSMGSDLVVGDVDADGYQDVIASGSSPDAIAWWKNNADYTFARYDITTNFNNAVGVAAGDVDNDGDLDVVGAASYADDIRIWKQVGGIPTEFVVLTLTPTIDEIPAEGGFVVFDAATVCTEPIQAQGWTMVEDPNGVVYGPLILVDLSLPEGEAFRSGLMQEVPAGAPAGVYTLRAYIGHFGLNLILSTDSFEFTKEGVVAHGQLQDRIEFPPGIYPQRLSTR